MIYLLFDALIVEAEHTQKIKTPKKVTTTTKKKRKNENGYDEMLVMVARF